MAISTYPQDSLHVNLTYHPQELQFGTSGRRGEVIHLTHLEIFINVVGELTFLQSLPLAEGGIRTGDAFYYAYDLRPSSSEYVPTQGNRGKLVQAVEQAIRYTGMTPINLGQIPTPALTYYAIAQAKGSIMVTGSHIPFDRNGYKTNTAKGELLKQHEPAINEQVKQVRAQFYNQAFSESLFTEKGFLKNEPASLPTENKAAAHAYLARYIDFFGDTCLAGLRVLVYQHSAVGRDLVVEILQAVGAIAMPIGRSDVFVPIDTENIQVAQLAAIQALYDDARKTHGAFDAIVSTDGDSDRPLLLAIHPETQAVQFISGDWAGMLTAEYLGAQAIVVPISSNDGIDYGALKHLVEPKTRIGSPYVISGMQKALEQGKQNVCGWEANGGFLTGSDIVKDSKRLSALPTRDAVLPILAVLASVKQANQALVSLVTHLPKRYGSAALLKQFPKKLGLAIVKQYSPSNAAICSVNFSGTQCLALDENNQELPASAAELAAIEALKNSLAGFFTPNQGFAEISQINYIDGVRIYFANGDIAHLRPSGNADELRIYAVANTAQRAHEITSLATQEPDGILRQLESSISA